jgi:peptidoglycan/LPS O-acetylase OafA/YrhL
MGVSRQSAREASWLRILRALLVLLVLVSFAAVQSASAMEIHPDHHGGPDDRCCAGGHAGHFPALHTVSTIQIAALSVAAWHAPSEVAPYTLDDGRTFNSSRAPPV